MISTADLQDWMKADDTDAPVLRALEESAVQAIQKLTGRYLGVTAQITEIIRFKTWPLELANEPNGGTLTSIEQWDGSAWSALQTSDYYVDGSHIWPNASFNWPVNPLFRAQLTRFRVVYSAGYTVSPTDSDVWPAPADIQHAVKLLVGHWFENRESVVVGTTAAEVPMSVQMLVNARSRVSV